VLPLERAGDNLFVRVQVGGVDAGPFLVSLSGERIVIDSALADRLKLPVARATWGPTGNANGAYLAQVGSIGIGGVRSHSRLAVVEDVEKWRSDYNGARFSGALGWPFLADYAFTIDLCAATLTLYEAGRFVAPGPPAVEEPVRLIGNVPAVRGRLNGKYSGWFTLDLSITSSFRLLEPFVVLHQELWPGAAGRVPAMSFDASSPFDSFAALGAAERPSWGQRDVVPDSTDLSRQSLLRPVASGLIGGPLLRNLRITFDVGGRRMWVERLAGDGDSGPRGDAEATARDLGGATPLIRALRAGRAGVAASLIESGADSNDADNLGRTPLMEACGHCEPRIVTALLRHGARVDEADSDGRTALMFAAPRNEGAVEALLAAGAKANLADHLGRTALDYAAVADQPGAVELLIAHGADPGHKSAAGDTALTTAAGVGSVRAMGALLRSHASLDLSNPLCRAAKYDLVSAARLLIKSGADVSSAGGDGRTPLMDAATYGSDDLVRLLLTAGADPSVKSKDGKTAFDCALDYSCICAANMLLEAGNRTAAEKRDARRPAMEVAVRRGGRCLFMPLSIDGARVGYVVLDTGAPGGLMVDATFASQHHFNVLKTGLKGQESTGTFSTSVVEMPKMSIGGVELGPNVALTADLSSLPSLARGAPVVAAGTPFDYDDQFTLDYIDGKVEIGGGSAEPQPGDTAFPLERVRSDLRVPAEIDDDEAYLAIDSGAHSWLMPLAPYCMLHPELLRHAAGEAWNPGFEGRTGRSVVLSGFEFHCCGTGPASAVADVPLYAALDPVNTAPGQIGNYFLTGRRLTLDPRRGRGWARSVSAGESPAAAVARLTKASDSDLAGTTPLLWAVYEGRFDAVRAIVDHGANPSTTSTPGESPLRAACRARSSAMASYLLEKGADPDSFSKTAAIDGHLSDVLGTLLSKSHTTAAELGGLLFWAAENSDLDCAKLLLAAGADVNARGDGGWTPLMMAAYSATPELAAALISHGADIGAVNVDGAQALALAAYKDDLEVARALLSHGADPNSVDREGRSPLMAAVTGARSELVSLLLRAGADPSVRDVHGLTAMDFAERYQLFDDAELIFFQQETAGRR